jgi:hypothetical protein
LFAADALQLAVLEDAKQLGLRGLVQVADLVQENNAAIGQLELEPANLECRADLRRSSRS